MEILDQAGSEKLKLHGIFKTYKRTPSLTSTNNESNDRCKVQPVAYDWSAREIIYATALGAMSLKWFLELCVHPQECVHHAAPPRQHWLLASTQPQGHHFSNLPTIVIPTVVFHNQPASSSLSPVIKLKEMMEMLAVFAVGCAVALCKEWWGS